MDGDIAAARTRKASFISGWTRPADEMFTPLNLLAPRHPGENRNPGCVFKMGNFGLRRQAKRAAAFEKRQVPAWCLSESAVQKASTPVPSGSGGSIDFENAP